MSIMYMEHLIKMYFNNNYACICDCVCVYVCLVRGTVEPLVWPVGPVLAGSLLKFPKINI